MRASRRITALAAATLLLIWIASMGQASKPEGPVTIVTLIDFSQPPFDGTFQVVEGAAILGCSVGTFVDTPAGVSPPTKGAIAKAFTCTSGGQGGFVANFQPFTAKPGPGFGNGNWNITDATEDFAGLHGQGDFSLVLVSPTQGEETLTGRIHFHP